MFFDEIAHQYTGEIERLIRELGHDDQGAMIALQNAVEFQFEIDPPDATTVNHVLDGLVAFLRSRGINLNRSGFAVPIAALRAHTAERYYPR